MARVSLVITARDETARAFRAINDRASRLGRTFIVPDSGASSLGEKIMRGLRNVRSRVEGIFSGGLSGVASRVNSAFRRGLAAVPGVLRRTFTSGLRGVAGVVGRGIVSGVRAGGRAIGSLFSGIFGVVRSVMTRVATMIRSMVGAGFISTMKAAMKALGPILVAILLPAVLLALAMVGAALAGALVFAFGAAFVGIAGFIASKAPAVKSAWKGMVEEVKLAWAGAGKAMEPVVIHGIGLLRRMADEFAPHFKEAMRGSAGPVQDFLDHFALSLKDFGKRAFKPMMEGFDAFLLALGPEWDGMMKGMGDAFGALGRTVRDHSGEIAMAFTGIIGLITTAVDIINFFANAWAIALRVITAGFGYLILYGVRPLLGAILFLATSALDGFTKAFGWIPGLGGKLKKANQGFKDWAKGINDSLTNMGNNAVDWGHRMDVANKKRKLKVDIGQYQKDLEQARADLKATMSAKAVKKLKADIAEWTAKLATAKKQLLTTTKAPAKAQLKADITDLQKKIARAKQMLWDQNHRKSKSAIRGDISDLQRKIASARAQLNALNGKTADTYVRTIYQQVGHMGGRQISGKASGGIIGMASGGLSRAGAATRDIMVGEAGPELVRLPPGAHVRPHGGSMMQGGGGGGVAVLEIRGDDSDMSNWLLKVLRKTIHVKGGNVQLVLGRGSKA